MKKEIILFFLGILLSLFIVACGGNSEENSEADIATAIAEAVTQIVEEAEDVAPAPTLAPAATATSVIAEEPQVEIPVGDMNPLTAPECDELSSTMGQTLGLMISSKIVPVTMSWSEEIGGACQMTALANGNDFTNIFVPSDAMKGMLQNKGWWGDMYLPCLGHGGVGPAGDQSCYFNENKVCEVMVTVKPADMSLCEGIEGPIGECLAAIPPEKQLYTINLTCAQGLQYMALPKTEPERIQFAAGATSAQVQDSLHPGGLVPYVLTAMAGQEMTVNLTATGAASIVIWGLDGTVLISDHADATSFVGILPLTQDYYIDVHSLDSTMIDYTLEVIVPPISRVFPDIEPFGFGTMQALVFQEVPLILPPAFSVSSDLPAIVPYLYHTEQYLLEASLDYGADCYGAGACHYGSMMASGALGLEPIGTPNFSFDINQSRQVTLEKGITGYFVESVCGANCSDAQVFWVYGGYQYMFGIKGASEADVVALANSAILNSVP